MKTSKLRMSAARAKLSLLVPVVIGVGIVGAAAAMTETADAAGPSWVVTKSSRTEISGHSGFEKALQIGGFRHPLYEISWSERSDEPCFMKVGGLTYVNGEWKGGEAEWAACAAKSASMKRVRVHAVHDNDTEARAIRAIQICTTDKKSSEGNKLKGVRIWSSRIDKQGQLTELDSMEEVRRTHCKKWHDKRSCPSGEVATGLYLQKRIASDTNDSNTIQGIGLQCGKIRRKG